MTTVGASPVVVVEAYGNAYDIIFNRLQRDNLMNSALSELYAANDAAENEAYDGLGRMEAWSRGTLDTAKDSIASPSYYQSFTLDALGNWTTLDDNGTSQTRDSNAANEITEIQGQAGWITPEYDDAGNMIVGPKPGAETTELHFVYDAWNRLVKVANSSDVTIAEYQFDGSGRRITKTADETTTHFFYNESGQVLETRVGDDPDPLDQYVWDIRYVDAPVVRFHDADTNGSYEDAGDNILYYCQDANWNVTAIVDAATGDVVERYIYDPYGKAMVLDEVWQPVSGNESAFANDRLYAGYARDAETGLYHTQAREYHCSLGSFIERDLAGYVDGMSLYQYCRSNPAAGTDPMGLCFGTAPYVDQYEARGPAGDTGVTGATGPEVDGSVPGGMAMRAPTGLETPAGPQDPSCLPAWLRELDAWTSMFTPGPLQATNLLHQAVATERAAREFSNYLQEAKEETGASSLWAAAPGAAFNFGVDSVLGAIPGISFLSAASHDQKHYDGAFFSGPNYTETTDLERVMLTAKGAVEMVMACLGAKFLGVRSANPTVTWVDEAAGMGAEARLYNSGAAGARSNLLTRQPQAPSIPGLRGPVRFDGEAPGLLIDRKLAVVTSPKAQSQALRQSAALRQNGLSGMWEVPDAAQAARARNLFNNLGIDNIEVRVVPR